MSCALEFPESSVKIIFCNQGEKQKILIEILTKYSEIDINELALTLNVSVKKLQNISNGFDFLMGEEADCLAQLFLMFLGKNFFRQCTLVRNFAD